MLAVSAVFLGSLYRWPSVRHQVLRGPHHKPSVAAYRSPVAPQTISRAIRRWQSSPGQIGAARSSSARDTVSAGRADGHTTSLGAQRRARSPGARRGASVLDGAAPWKAGAPPHRLRGTGLSLGGWLGGLQPTGATVRLNPDGGLSVLTGQVDIAGTNIALAQIAASAYGVDIEKVKITTGDTDVAPVTGLSAGSKTIYTVGVAVMQAAQNARRQTLEIAASEMEAAIEDLEIVDGRVVVRGMPDRGITLTQIGKKGNLYMSKVEPVLGSAHPAFTQQAPAFAAQIARVELDPDTGELVLHGFVVVQDAGRAINPLAVEGQMQGGAVQSLGIALTEALSYDDQGRSHQSQSAGLSELTAADREHRDCHRQSAVAEAVRSARACRRTADRPALAAIANGSTTPSDPSHGVSADSGAHRPGDGERAEDVTAAIRARNPRRGVARAHTPP